MERFIPRDISLLRFNKRVLHEAKRESNPLLERLKFCAIVAANCEEFFMVRIAGLLRQQEAKRAAGSSDAGFLNEVLREYRSLLAEHYRLTGEVMGDLRKKGITIIQRYEDYLPYAAMLDPFITQDVLPVLTPLSVGPMHPFPHLTTGKLYIAIELKATAERTDRIEKTAVSFMEIPTKIFGRFLMPEENVFVPLEIALTGVLSQIYTGYTIESVTPVHVTRDTDLQIEEENVTDLLAEIESVIKRLHTRSIVRIMTGGEMPLPVKKIILSKNEIADEVFYPVNGLLMLQDCLEVYTKVVGQHLRDDSSTQYYPSIFRTKDIFKTIASGDIMLYHPYQSYAPVVELLEAAAADPDVLAVKQTLYRTNNDSGVIKALIKAAESGKQVSVVVELKARFDEKRNIAWAKELEDAGAHVMYGLSGVKTHAKCLLIIRREKKGIVKYIHTATGNYNEKTASLYCDISLFTAEKTFGSDASVLFNLLTGFSYPTAWQSWSVSPFTLRKTMTAMIQREAAFAEKGVKAQIILKMNSLEDSDLCEELYTASQKGVKIDLIVRGICILRPGGKGLSENITVHSIIGRYLEHARIYYFQNGGIEEFYCASADMMTRNLDRRVEIMFPVFAESGKKLLKNIVDLQMQDDCNRWRLHQDGEYKRIGKGENDSFRMLETLLSEKSPEKKVLKPLKKKRG